MSCFILFALVQRVGAGGTGLPILRELSYSIFLEASANNTVRLSIKLFDLLISIKRLSNVYQRFRTEL